MTESFLDHSRGPYDATTVALHWITGALVITLWLIGQLADGLPPSVRESVWSVHVTLGIVLGLVLLTRVAWRARFGRVLPPANDGVLHWVATATHYALYLLLFVVVVSGIANASYRAFHLFDMWSFPQFGTGDRATRHSINGWHGLAANTILAVSLIHAAAALFHHYVWRDRLISRMLFGGRAGQTPK